MTTDTALALLAEQVALLKECRDALQCHARQETKSLRERMVVQRNRITALLDSGGWLPIETAPKNHLPILVYGPYGQLVAFKDITWAWWPVPASEKLDYTPTHWQPLSPLPKGDIK